MSIERRFAETNTMHYESAMPPQSRSTHIAADTTSLVRPRYSTSIEYAQNIASSYSSSASSSAYSSPPSNLNSNLNSLVPSSYYTSGMAEKVMGARIPVDTRETATITVRVNGVDITGVWLNRDECVNWRGPVPLDRYKLNTDVDTTLIKKTLTHAYDQVQTVSVRHLKPPPLPAAGSLIVRHEEDVQLPAAPPIIVRQTVAEVRAPPTLVYRERPPVAPMPVPEQVVRVPGRVLDPPPRQIIVERMPAKAPLPQDVLVERWLAYDAQRRNVVHQQAAPRTQLVQSTPKNALIEWEAVDNTRVQQRFNYLGVECVEPAEYERRHGGELVETRRLPAIASSEQAVQIPRGETLAVNANASGLAREFILTGDVDALKLVDTRLNNLSEYLVQKYN